MARRLYYKIFSLISFILIVGIFFVSCFDGSIKYRNTKIAHLSDLHYYSPALGTSGQAFNDYISRDRKLLAESSAISEKAVELIKESDAEIVLITGDLTKDGEKINHLEVANLLYEIEATGKMVYVINGNHDIYNPHAVEYIGDITKPVEYITPEDFKEIYNDFGYSEALYRDPDSLSYIVEPYKGLWIFALDSCKYDTNVVDGHPYTGGFFSQEKLAWIMDKLAEAKQKKKIVYVMMHHGLLEHFTGQKQYFGEYVIDQWEEVSTAFADMGVKMAFTGHFHARDIIKKETSKKNFIYDVETGSLVTYPCPYRSMVMIRDKKLIIKSNRIEDISYDTGGIPFQDYAKNYIEIGLHKLVVEFIAGILINQGMPPAQAMEMATQISNTELAPSFTVNDLLTDGMISHYEGDEKPTAQVTAAIQGLLNSPNQLLKGLGALAQYIWNDPIPGDNNIIIDLKKGKIIK